MTGEKLGIHSSKTTDFPKAKPGEVHEDGLDSVSFDLRAFCRGGENGSAESPDQANVEEQLEKTTNASTPVVDQSVQESGTVCTEEGGQLSMPRLDARVFGPCINEPIDSTWKDRSVVVGSGAYGTAICNRLASFDRDTLILARDQEVVTDINTNRRNSKNLMGLELSRNLRATVDCEQAYFNRGIVVLAVPSTAIASVMRGKNLHEDTIIVSMAKGLIIEGWDHRDPRYSLSKGPPQDVVIRTPLQYLAQHESTKHIKNLAVVAGPGFASDIVSGNVLDLTVAGTNHETVSKVFDLFLHSGTYTYPTGTKDTIGVELASVMKNVIAVMVGICDRLREYDGSRCFPPNVTEFIKSRGMEEAGRLIKNFGGKQKTLNLAAGWADLNLTTSSTMGRNFSLGRALADGAKIDEIVRREGKVVEGAWSAWAVKRMTDDMEGKLGLYMPVTNALVDIMKGVTPPAVRLEKLLRDVYVRQCEENLRWRSGKGVEVVNSSSSSISSDAQLH
jgi:glycerol-3-phosphate dehydrogenase (NAD(P)+)